VTLLIVITCRKQQLVDVSGGIFLQRKPDDAENHVGHLVLPEGELHLIPRVVTLRIELEQLRRFAPPISAGCVASPIAGW
jgi:hypothetical protein